jgi:hypothetical protein
VLAINKKGRKEGRKEIKKEREAFESALLLR